MKHGPCGKNQNFPNSNAPKSCNYPQKPVVNQQTQLQANFRLFYKKMMIPPLAVKLWRLVLTHRKNTNG